MSSSRNLERDLLFCVLLSNELSQSPGETNWTVRVLIKIRSFPRCHGFLNTKANTLKTAVTTLGYGSLDIIVFYTIIV